MRALNGSSCCRSRARASADNDIGSPGAAALAGALKVNTVLLALDLWSEFGARGWGGCAHVRLRLSVCAYLCECVWVCPCVGVSARVSVRLRTLVCLCQYASMRYVRSCVRACVCVFCARARLCVYACVCGCVCVHVYAHSRFTASCARGPFQVILSATGVPPPSLTR